METLPSIPIVQSNNHLFPLSQQTVIMYRVLGCCALLVLALAAEVIQAEEYSYNVVSSSDVEDEVVITDAEGNVVSTVIAFPNEGFEVILPADSNECDIKAIDDDSPCYQDLPVSEPLPEEVITACAGREIRNLVPSDCGGAGAVGDRKKRQVTSTCCRWTKHVTTTCVSKYCCKKVLGICTKKCCNNKVTVSYTQQCVTGYE